MISAPSEYVMTSDGEPGGQMRRIDGCSSVERVRTVVGWNELLVLGRYVASAEILRRGYAVPCMGVFLHATCHKARHS